MEKQVSLGLGITLSALAVAGFVQKEKHVIGLMNVDTNHSMIRIPVAALLFYGSQSNLKATRGVLTATGVIYLLIGAAGIVDRKVGGVLPSKLTGFDLVYHFAVGIPTLLLGLQTGRIIKR